MGRKAQFPPRVHTRQNYSRVHWKGRWWHLGPAGSEEAARRYQQLVKQWSAETGAHPARRAASPGDPTVADVVRQYLELQAQKRRGKRELENIRAGLAILTRLLGRLPAHEFKAGRLEDLQTAYATGSWMNEAERERRRAHRQPVGWCRNQVNLQVGRVRTCWRWAERKGLVPEGAWAALRALPGLARGDTLAREVPPRRPSALEDVAKVAALCPAPVAAMLLIQWHTGMRSGEVRIMRTCDVDKGDPTCWVYRPRAHKNAHRGLSREVAIGPAARLVLGPWLKPDDPEAYLFQPVGNRAVRGYYERTSYAESVRRAARKLGLSLCPYQSRHAFKRRVSRELGPQAAKDALGHHKLQTTDEYDRGVNLDNAKDAARKCG